MNRIQDSDTDVKHGCPTWLLLYLGFLPKANMTWNTRLSSCFPAMFGGAPRVLHMNPRWICPIPPWMDPSTLSKHGQEWNYTSWCLGYNLEISQANFRGFHQPRIKLEGRNRNKIGILHFTRRAVSNTYSDLGVGIPNVLICWVFRPQGMMTRNETMQPFVAGMGWNDQTVTHHCHWTHIFCP